jgi:hypothetical protein
MPSGLSSGAARCHSVAPAWSVVEREREEGGADEAMDPPLGALERVRVHAARLEPEPPEEHARGRALDHAVEPEADERDALGARAGKERDPGLEHVVGERRGDEPESDPRPVCPFSRRYRRQRSAPPASRGATRRIAR